MNESVEVNSDELVVLSGETQWMSRENECDLWCEYTLESFKIL